MNAISQNILNGAVAVVIAAVLWSVQPKIELKPHGILLPATAKTYPATTASQVQIYTSAPQSYTTVGQVNTAIHFDQTDQATNQQNFQASLAFAQQLAATAGANGLLLQMAGPTSGGVNPLDGFLIYAKAILVNDTTGAPQPLTQSPQ